MALSKRLQTLLSMIDPCDTLIDIGSDHALLCIEAVKSNLAQKAIAIDNKSGPLKTAQININNHQLTDRVSTLLSDGALELKQAGDCWVIAGVGAETMIQILDESKEKVQQVNQLILSPHSKPESVREYLLNHGFKILSEQLVYDHKWYIHIKAVYSGNINESSFSDYHLGLLKKDVQYPKWIEHQFKKYKQLSINNDNFKELYQLFNLEYERSQSQDMEQD